MSITRFLATLVFASFLVIATVGRAANDCGGKSLLGGSCSTSCGPGFHGECSGGVFTAECKCVKDANTQSHGRQIPDVTPKQITDSQQFETWARNSGSNLLAQLADETAIVRNAVLARNAGIYGEAEFQFNAQWQGLPESDKAAITQWQIEHGYGN